MLKCILVISALLILCSAQLLLAQDTGIPDTLYYGDNGKAYGYPGGIYYVPVYVTTDQEIAGLQFVMEYGLGTLTPAWDSVGLFGSIFMEGNYLELGFPMINDISINGELPDTLVVGGAAISNYLPPGGYLLCNVWFTGGDVGQQVVVDTTYHVTVGETSFYIPMGQSYIPEFVGGGTLEIVEGSAGILPILPDSIVGDAASLIIFDIGAAAIYEPVTLVLDSIINAGTGDPLPYLPATSGSNPLTVEWTPTYDEYGNWWAWFTATDAQQNSLEFSALIKVNFVQPPCDVLRGDADCDEIVNISDVVYLLNYIFNQGPPPGCDDE